MVLAAAARHGVAALRSPVEPGRPRGSGWLAAPFARALRRTARRRGMVVPDRVFGLSDTGRMTADVVCAAIARSGDGLSEIYLHPATRDDFDGHASGYRHRAEFESLVDGRCADAVAMHRIRLGSFGQLGGAR